MERDTDSHRIEQGETAAAATAAATTTPASAAEAPSPPRPAFADRPLPNFILRLLVMLAGIACVAFGIAVSRATDLGLAPISTLPGVINYAAPAISLGTATFAFNVLLVLVQIGLLGRRFHPIQLLSIPFVVVFSALIDCFVPMAMALPMPSYPVRLLFCLASCAIIALGVWLQAKAALILLPGDGFAWAVGSRFNLPFGKAKMIADSSLIALAALLSFALMGGLYGVREGSIIAAVMVGLFIRGLNAAFPGVERVLPLAGHITWIPRNEAEESGRH